MLVNIESGLYELVFASPETLLQVHRNVLLTLSKKEALEGNNCGRSTLHQKNVSIIMICGGSFCFMSLCLIFLYCWRLMYVFIFLVTVTEWPPIGIIAAHSAYEMFSWYRYLIVSLVFSHLGFLEWESFADCSFS